MTLPDLDTGFVGRRGALFGLALRMSLLTVLTLGLYRFWMKTRLRRWYWSAIRPGGHPLEYVGEPLEKLLGFLIAVAFLAFYIGVVNLILMFLAFALLNGDVWAYAVSFLGIIPVVFFAQYRARRYLLSRTRWRGIRFGLEPAAWGYAWRSVGHWVVTILSLGLLWPRMTFGLEKYVTDRTWYGDARLVQTGRWPSLYRAALHVGLGAAILLIGAGLVLLSDDWDLMADIGGTMLGQIVGPVAGVVPIGWAVAAAVLGFVWLGAGIMHYRVRSFRQLTAGKRLILPGQGDFGAGAPLGPGLRSDARTGRVLWIHGFGNVVSALLMLVALIPAGIVLAIVLGVAESAFQSMAQQTPDLLEKLGAAPLLVQSVIGLAAYFALFILWGVLRQVFVTLPLIAHYAGTLTLTDPRLLSDVRQRDRDSFAEADGLAEALDLGAGL